MVRGMRPSKLGFGPRFQVQAIQIAHCSSRPAGEQIKKVRSGEMDIPGSGQISGLTESWTFYNYLTEYVYCIAHKKLVNQLNSANNERVLRLAELCSASTYWTT
jgi:hypothetical protein